MDNADLQVLTQLAKWISNDKKCWLCTVVKTWGSSPRPVGSLLVCNEAGNIAGSLSGGCVEEDLLEKLTQGTLASERPKLLVYGSTTEEVERFNLPCGGQLHVIIEPFTSNEYLPEIEGLVSRLRQRECIERVVDIETGSMTVSEAARFKHLAFNGDFDHPEQTTGVVLNHTYGPRYELMLIGAGPPPPRLWPGAVPSAPRRPRGSLPSCSPKLPQGRRTRGIASQPRPWPGRFRWRSARAASCGAAGGSAP